MWHDDEEFEAFAAAVNELMAEGHNNDSKGRRRRVMTTVVLPIE